MRYSARHKERTRGRILTSAGRRFREKGFEGAGVDDVMESAGLTAGAFYGHFDSKEALLAEALAAGLPDTVERLLAGLETLDGVAWLLEVVRRYLSRSHRKDVAEGCALPALATEVGRQGPRARRAFEAYVRGIVRSLEGKAPGAPGLSPEDRMLATVALFAGGLMLARAVRDEPLSDRILRACRPLAVPEAYAGETPAPSSEEGASVRVTIRRFENASHARTFDKGRFDVVDLAGLSLGRARYEPGWRWSTHVGTASGQTSCPVEHVGLVLEGRACIRMDDGEEVVVGPGDLFHCPAGHDSWVVGDAPYVSLHFLGASEYAKK